MKNKKEDIHQKSTFNEAISWYIHSGGLPNVTDCDRA